ncbi:transcriptional regulator ovo-like [Anopheles stephensi]|uniref:Uncharacterized protein n=1 Tax=Anopheles stephensi TaxID=30069 RepID=A0A182YQR3_ANOST|nr:transcriptional regulator ovo-like [Anopheles stephensi]
MKTSMILLLCAAIVLVAAEDKKSSAPVHDAKQQYGQQQQQQHGQQHGQQQQLKQQHAQDQHHQAPGSQQHTLKHDQQQQHAQPLPAHKYKREAPKNTAAGHSTTAAPKATVDPKQPSVLPALVGQPPKTKRDTVAAQPAAQPARPATNVPAKAGTTGAANQQRQPASGPRPNGAKLNREQSSNTPKATTNAKAPATVNQQSSSTTTATPAKKV